MAHGEWVRLTKEGKEQLTTEEKEPFPSMALPLGSACFLTDIGISLSGLFITVHVTQQPAELFTVDGVHVGFWGEKPHWMKQERSGKRAAGEGGRGGAGLQDVPEGREHHATVGAVRGSDWGSVASTSPGCKFSPPRAERWGGTGEGSEGGEPT